MGDDNVEDDDDGMDGGVPALMMDDKVDQAEEATGVEN
jgi:hypothetical protein